MKHFLLFQIKSVCYDSYTYFSNAVAKELISAGHSVEIFSLAKEPIAAMERYVGSTFDAILDFNSELSRLQMDDGTFFLDQINAPFYNVILDHPLYHHDMLKQKIKNFHILCLDENHKTYIETNYPHIASVHVWSMTGEDILPSQPGYPAKDIDILFSGTYTDYRQVEASIDTCPSFLGELTRELIAQMRKDSGFTQEAALKHLLPSLDEVVAENFPLHMQACFLCDTWLRAWQREEILMHLAKSGLPVTLCGNGWQNSPLAGFPQITVMSDTSFKDTFSLFRRAKITLNIMPGFKNGTHDRIYSSMLNHSLCLTDSTPLLRRQFKDNRELCFYDTQNMEGLVCRISALLSAPKELETITEAGYQRAKENHTWQSRVAYFLSIV